jgi:hypothetical protein
VTLRVRVVLVEDEVSDVDVVRVERGERPPAGWERLQPVEKPITSPAATKRATARRLRRSHKTDNLSKSCGRGSAAEVMHRLTVRT